MSNKKIPWILLFLTWTLFANALAQIQIPRVFMLNGENDKAIEYYKKSAEINPDNLNGIRFIKVLSNYRKMEMQINVIFRKLFSVFIILKNFHHI